MSLATPTSRTTQDMREYAEATPATKFLVIDIGPMAGWVESDTAAHGVVVQPVGILFRGINGLVTNAEVADALQLRCQQLEFLTQGRGIGLRRRFSGNYAEALPNKPDSQIVTSLVNHTPWNRTVGRKAWVIKMRERLFLSKKAASVNPTVLQALYEIYKIPGKLLGCWKLGMHQFPEEKRVFISTFNLMMAYVLRNSSYRDPGEREGLNSGPASSARSSIFGLQFIAFATIFHVNPFQSPCPVHHFQVPPRSLAVPLPCPALAPVV